MRLAALAVLRMSLAIDKVGVPGAVTPTVSPGLLWPRPKMLYLSMIYSENRFTLFGIML
jgi:hypothetical protein